MPPDNEVYRLSSAKKLTREQKEKAYKDVTPIARQFRQNLLPSDQKVLNAFWLLEEKLGFFIVKFPSEDNNLSGFHITKSGIHCIYINSAQVLGRQYFSLWHECYHAINNQVSVSYLNKLDCDIEEYKAECFASNILMPENLVADYIKKSGINFEYISYNQLINMQHSFKVSYKALIHRLIELYPRYKITLTTRYGLGSIAKAQELENRTRQLGLDTSLIKPTNDIYVSPGFIEDIQYNLGQKRISNSKAEALISILEEMGSSK